MLWGDLEFKNYEDMRNYRLRSFDTSVPAFSDVKRNVIDNLYGFFLRNIQKGRQVEESKAFLATMLAKEDVYLHQSQSDFSNQEVRKISDDLLENAYKYPDFAEYAADRMLDTQNQDPNREYFHEFAQRKVVLPRHLHQKIVDRIASFPDSGKLFIDFGAYTSNTKAPWTAEDLLRLPKTKDGNAANYLSNLIAEGSPELKDQYIDHVLTHKGELGHAPFQALLSSMSWASAIPNDKHAKILDAYMNLHPEGVLDALTSYSKNPLRNLTDEEVRNLYQKAQKHIDGKVATEIELASKDSNASPQLIEMIDNSIRNMYRYKLQRFEDEFENRKPEKRAANLWYEYERSVEPEHFALAKSLHTNQPETVTDHRGHIGSSDLHCPHLDAFRDYAKKTQEEVLRHVGQEDEDGHPVTGSLPAIKVNGQWHVKVYRGVAGDYADTILKGIQHPDSTPDDLKILSQTVSIPSAHLSSWTTDPSVATRFASRNIEGQQREHGIIIGAHLPVSQILHSGFLDVFPNQAHAHPHEAELIFHHAEKPVHVDTDDIQVLNPNTGKFKTVQYVPPEEPKTEDMNKTEYHMPKPEMENNVAFVQKHGKHLFEQLPLNKRMGLMSLMEACDIPKNHPHYYGIIVNKPFDYIKSQPFREHLNQKMGLDDFDSKRMYTQMQEATSMIKQYAEDTVHDPVNDTFHQSSSLKTKFKKHDEHDTFLRPMSEKAKDTIISWGHKHGAEYEEDKDVVGDMVGAQAKFDALIEAAKFVAGRKDIPLDRMRHSFVLFEDDIEAAALHAAGLKDTEANRTAIREVAKMADFVKFDTSLERPKAILPTDKSSKNTAEEVNSAFDSGDVRSIKLTGKHSKGTLIARDPKTHHVWLIKPGSGATSPAAGVAEETASQSAREAAFSHVARLWHLGNVVVKAEMLKVDGQEWAALAMLPYNYQNADKWKTQDYAFLVRTLDSYRAEGTLHKLAVLDFVLGNPDRHAQNVMVSKEGQITMIDHGSAFAGSMFSPDKDTKSFVPFYLRYNTREFNKMDRERKLAIMPKMPRLMHKKFVEWIGKLDAKKMAEEIQRFGINPAACLKRLEIIKALPHAPAGDATIDEMVNALWLDT